jgi:hypothetical protein
MKPNDRAKSLLINALYFTNNKIFAFELSLYITTLILEQKLQADDLEYWSLVKQEIYKRNK